VQSAQIFLNQKLSQGHQFVHQVGKLWSVAQSIRSQMKITALRHPLSYSFTGDSLIGTAIILLPSITSKVALDFLITPEIVRSWPKSVGEVEVRARVIYGSAEYVLSQYFRVERADLRRSEARLTAAAKETVGSALGEGYLGVWLQSCVDVAGQY